jgi:hypothetical protein
MKKTEASNMQVESNTSGRRTIYTSPKLTNFGPVTSLTRALNKTMGNDGSADSMQMSIS